MLASCFHGPPSSSYPLSSWARHGLAQQQQSPNGYWQAVRTGLAREACQRGRRMQLRREHQDRGWHCGGWHGLLSWASSKPPYAEGLVVLPVRRTCLVSQTAAGPGAWISGWTDPRGKLETQGGSVSRQGLWMSAAWLSVFLRSCDCLTFNMIPRS